MSDSSGYQGLVSGSKGATAALLALVGGYVTRGLSTHDWSLDLMSQQMIVSYGVAVIMGLWEVITNVLKHKYNVDITKWVH